MVWLDMDLSCCGYVMSIPVSVPIPAISELVQSLLYGYAYCIVVNRWYSLS